MQYTPNVGGRPEPNARRDAIHVAVAPVIAAEQLRPGEQVGLDESGHATREKAAVGIVDPFLPPHTYVEEGQSFWLFLFPNTVTSLRHVWTHPAFERKLPFRRD